MTLSKTTLKDALEIIFTSATFPNTLDAAAIQWASAYKTYAADANSCASNTPNTASLTTAETTLKSALLTVFTAGQESIQTRTQIASALATAFQTFWLIPPMVFGATGVVITVTGTSVLASTLESLWIGNSAEGSNPTPSEVADDHATLLDTFTKTVTVSEPSVPCTALIV
jgi:hypothetical protein